MIRLVASLLAFLSLTAAAAAQDADTVARLAEALNSEASARAEALKAAPAAPAGPLQPGDGFITDVERFALEAVRLSRAIETAGGAEDLKCIFRGMSEDASARLEALAQSETRAERARVYLAYAGLFEDAAIIAADAGDADVAPASCAAQ